MSKRIRLFFLIILLLLSFGFLFFQDQTGYFVEKFILEKEKKGTPKFSQRNLPTKKKYYDVLKKPPKNANDYYKRGRAWRKLGNRKKAIQEFAKAIELNPNHAGAWFQRGNQYLFEENYDQALIDLNRAIELNPNNSNAYNDRGNIHRQKDNNDKAILDYNKAIELNPKTRFAYHNRGNAWRDKGYYEKAISDYNEAIKHRKSALTHYFRGMVLIENGYYDQAISALTKSIEINPKDALAYEHRGDAWYNKDCYERALADYKQAQKLSSKLRSYNWKKEHAKNKSSTINFFDPKNFDDRFIQEYVQGHTGEMPDKYITLGNGNYLIYLNNAGPGFKGLYYLEMNMGGLEKVISGYVHMEDTWTDSNKTQIFLFRAHEVPKNLGWQSIHSVVLEKNNFGMNVIKKGRLAFVGHYSPRAKCTDKSKSLGLTVQDTMYIFWHDRLFKSKDGTILLNINTQDCEQKKKIFGQQEFYWKDGYFVMASPLYEGSGGKGKKFTPDEMVRKIKKAHKQSLKEYKKTRNKMLAKKILDEANINYIFFKAPSTISADDYVRILSSYALYSIEHDPVLAISLLDWILSLDSRRAVAHLNMAKALDELLQQKVISQNTKEEVKEKIVHHYGIYKKLSGK